VEAARQGAMLGAHLGPREAEAVLEALGNTAPSKSQDHFTLRCQAGIGSRGGENRTGSGRLVPFMEHTGRCQGSDQSVSTDLGLVSGQRETILL